MPDKAQTRAKTGDGITQESLFSDDSFQGIGMPRVSFMTERPAYASQVHELKRRISEHRHAGRFVHCLVVVADEEVDIEPPCPPWTSIGFDVHVPPRDLLRADAPLHEEVWQEILVALEMAADWCKQVGLDLLIYFEENGTCEMIGDVGPTESHTEILHLSLHPDIK